MAKVAVILPAAGQSSRFKDKEKKPFALLDGRAVWLRTAELFITRDDVCQCLLVIAPGDRELLRRRFAANLAFMEIQVIDGGNQRFDSVANALAAVKPEADLVAIHDAVRPCLTTPLIDSVFARAEETGAALLGVPVTDTLKRVDNQHKVLGTMPRQGLWQAQTPQVFRRDWVVEAYAKRSQAGKEITDDAQLVEAAGHPVHVVEGAASNLKITTRGDLFLADAILKSMPRPKPAGPIHPFDEGEMWGGLPRK